MPGATLDDYRIEDGALVYRRTAELRSFEMLPDRYPELPDAVMRLEEEDSRAVVFVAAP